MRSVGWVVLGVAWLAGSCQRALEGTRCPCLEDQGYSCCPNGHCYRECAPGAVGGGAGSDANGGTESNAGSDGVAGSDANGGVGAEAGASFAGGAGLGAGGSTSSEQSGGTNAGGAPADGGAHASGGEGGCTSDAECPNPHRATCSAKCNDGVCELAPSSSLDVAFQSGPQDTAPRAGFWDENGAAYLVYPSVQTEPIGFLIRALDGEGALGELAAQVQLPPAISEVDLVTAAFRDDRLALLWHATRPKEEHFTVELALTDLSATADTTAATLLLNSQSIFSLYPDYAYTLVLYPLPGDLWATITYTGTGPEWRGYIVDPAIVPVEPPLMTSPLRYGPRSIAGRAPIRAIAQSAAIVENVLFVTGYDCDWSGSLACEPWLVFSRYDATTLEPLSPDYVRLSTASYPMVDGRQRPPAVTKLGDGLAVLWTQYSSSGTLLLGRAVFDTSGTIRTTRAVEPSDLTPKAVVESPSGGALLIASRVTSTGEAPEHTLVAQPLDGQLNFVGEPRALGAASSEEPTAVVITPNDDGLLLLTFRQGYAQHRILHADFCR